MENNGIGWITVNEKEVKERIPPSKERNPFIQLIDKNIRKLGNKLVVLALGRWKFGKFIENMRKGKNYGDFNVPYEPTKPDWNKGWIAIPWAKTIGIEVKEENDALQWNISVGYGHSFKRKAYKDKVFSGLNIERPIKDYRKIFKKIDEKKFLKLLHDLPEDYLCWYYQKEKVKGRPKEITEVVKKATEISVSDIRNIIKYMTGKYGGYFSVSKVVWKEGFSEKKAKQKLNDVEKELKSIFDYLFECKRK